MPGLVLGAGDTRWIRFHHFLQGMGDRHINKLLSGRERERLYAVINKGVNSTVLGTSGVSVTKGSWSGGERHPL